MEIENKKFRCHGSIVLEQCAKAIAGILFFAVLNFGELLGESFEMNESVLKEVLFFMGILAVILIVVLGISIIKWRKTTIMIEDDVIVWERNTLNKKTLTISIKSISSINIERNIFERIIGTAKLKLDTSSLSTSKSTDVLFIFKYEDALSYKEYLESKVRRIDQEFMPKQSLADGESADSEGVTGQIYEKEAVEVSYISKPQEIILHCIFSASVIGVLLGIGVTAFGIWEIAAVIRSGVVGLGEFIGFVIVVLTFGSATIKSLVGKFFQFFDLTVSKKGNRIYVKYGMFKIKEYVIPIEKINAIYIKQKWIGRLFGRYSVHMECIGLGNEQNEMTQLTLSLPYEEVIKRLHCLLPEYEVEQLANLKKISPKVVCHKIKRFFILTIFVVGALVGFGVLPEIQELSRANWWFVPVVIGVVLFLYALFLVNIFLQLKTEAIALGEKHMFISNGTYCRDIVIVPYKKIQYLELRKSPISKYTNIVSGHINIQAGTLDTVKAFPYIDMEEVEDIKQKLIWRG